ncbi:MAG: rhomboid family intramembrane serine protease [Acidobacteriales bacterium]|nr:rhomboid family intramembrane serine protease [Terriglobales bacterium]
MYRGRTFSLSLPPFTRAVKWLVLINAGVYLLITLLQSLAPNIGDFLFDFLALMPAMVTHGFLWQLVTYSFLHSGLFHLLFNMLALWMFGAQLETDWGHRKFFEFYGFCVIGAALTTIAVSYTGLGGVTARTMTVGASGGIYGILMAFGMLYGDQEIMLFPIPFSIRAKYFVGAMGFIALVGALGAGGGRGSAIAYFAHLGGLLFGFLYLKFMPRRGLAYGASEQYYGVRNSYYRWKRRRAARKFEVYMRKHNRTVYFDEHGNYIPPDDYEKSGTQKPDGGSKSGWVN